jgi:hypothetical protein
MRVRVSIHSKRTALLMVVGWAASLVPMVAFGQLGLGMSPMRTEVRFQGQNPHSGVLTLTNESGTKVRIKAEVVDFFLDNTGTPQFPREAPAEKPFSCRALLTANPMEMEMESGTNARIRYTLRPPPDPTPRSYHCGLAFTTLPTQQQKAAVPMGMSMAVRIVSAFYGVVGSPPISGSLKAVRLDKALGKEGPVQTALLTWENSGDMHFRPFGTVEVIAADGAVTDTVELPPTAILPRRTQVIPVVLPRILSPGKWSLRTKADLGSGEIMEATAQVSVGESPPQTPPAVVARDTRGAQ